MPISDSKIISISGHQEQTCGEELAEAEESYVQPITILHTRDPTPS